MHKGKHYQQKFCNLWYDDPALREWIEPSNIGQTAYCRVCKCNLTGSKSIMHRHAGSPKHIVKMQASYDPITRAQETVEPKRKKKRVNMSMVRQAEIRLCAYIAEQNLPLTIMDTLPGLLKTLDPESEVLEHIQCSHTKTAYIMKNALAADTITTISKKLQDNFFSLIIDDCSKTLSIIVRYYNEETRDVEDSFLNILDVEEDVNGLNLYQSVMSFLGSINVPVENFLALAQYCNPNTNTKKQPDRLKELSQYVYVPGCVCLSFHVCASEACKILPTPIEDMCNDIYKFIQKKPKRLAELKQIQSLLNLKSRNLIKISKTRRLSIFEVVDRIVENWDALLSYFSLAAIEDREEKAESILQSLRNPIYKAYILFLNFFLPSVDNLLQESQNTTKCLPALLSSIVDQLKTILRYYMLPSYVNDTQFSMLNPADDRYLLPVEQMFFGNDVAALLTELETVYFNDIHDFKVTCLNFYVEFCNQLLKRVDFTDPVSKHLLMLSPGRCKSDLFFSIIPLAKQFPNVMEETSYEQLDREWRLVKSTSTLSADLKFMSFWNVVFDQKYATKEARYKYPLLSKFVKSMLCLPHSSGATEKIFAGVNSANSTKCKLRKKRETPMLNSLLLTKEKLKRSSAKDFEISSELLTLAKSAKIKNVKL